MENDGAMRVDDAFGKTSRAGSETHSSAVIFVDFGIGKFLRRGGQQFFVVQKTIRNFAAAIRNDNDFFEWRIGAKFFEDRKEYVIDDEETVLRVPRDGRDFVRMEAQIESVKNPSRAGYAKKGFEMAGMIPHHGGDA